MKFKKATSLILSVLIALAVNNLCCCFADEVEDAELLYTQITKFLSEHRDVLSERFDDVCKDFMNSGAPRANLLSRAAFEERSNGNIILYRGMRDKKYVDEFKQGKFLVSGYNPNNFRGMGIYTTTSFICARVVYGEESPDNVIEMFISKDEAKILDYQYLERLKQIIIERHSKNPFRETFDYRCATCPERAFVYVEKKMDDFDGVTSAEYADEEATKKEELAFRNSREEYNYHQICKEMRIWRNLGLLTKLLGYDVLCTRDDFACSIGGGLEEYLVVNPGVLNILAE